MTSLYFIKLCYPLLSDYISFILLFLVTLKMKVEQLYKGINTKEHDFILLCLDVSCIWREHNIHVLTIITIFALNYNKPSTQESRGSYQSIKWIVNQFALNQLLKFDGGTSLCFFSSSSTILVIALYSRQLLGNMLCWEPDEQKHVWYNM